MIPKTLSPYKALTVPILKALPQTQTLKFENWREAENIVADALVRLVHKYETQSVQISVKRHDKELPMPTRHGDWIDLCAAETVDLKQGDFYKINLGVSIKLPEGWEGWLLPRGSTFEKYHILITHSMGIIDNPYCGDNDIWKLPVYAVADSHIEKGERICQFRIAPIQPDIIWKDVEFMPYPNRGGFGSTGRN